MTRESSPRKFIDSLLPWAVAGGALLIYLVTLNHWVSMTSLASVAKVAGWDWRPSTTAPLQFLLTWPFRLFPAGLQPVALNVFSAICGALTLALLARSVSLMPHDRTRDQRQREPDEKARLSISAAWVPPLVAAIICGLQLSFWEHATAATGEMLDLLIFAYVIRCLLEFRISENEKWLFKMALVYGLGVTNNWAMIGYFPLFLIALMWIKGWSFFKFEFVLRMLGFGAAGLLLYLLLPAIDAASANPSGSFWQTLKANLASQKGMTWNNPFIRAADYRLEFFTLALTSLLPVFLIGIRWPSFQGDISPAAYTMAIMMFRFLHLMFLAFSLWVFFDPEFSGRILGRSYISFLSFYYLAALTAGYLIGYVLLVFGREAGKNWQRSKSNWFRKSIAALVIAASVGVPAGLLWKNWGAIRATNGPELRRFARSMAETLPEKDAVILSDDPYRLFLLHAIYAQAAEKPQNLLMESASLPYAQYHRVLQDRYPSFTNRLYKADNLPAYLNPLMVLNLVAGLKEKHRVFYLHPSFGYYFELFYSRPHGLVHELKLYEKDVLIPPALTPDEISENEKFWADFKQSSLNKISPFTKSSTDMGWLGMAYSRALNTWGVEMQKLNRLPEAKAHFSDSLILNPDNVAALVNEQFNAQLQKGGEIHGIESNKEIDKKLGQYRGWEAAMSHNGDFDELEVCLRLGQVFTEGNNLRQGTAYFLRVLELSPTHTKARLELIGNYSDLGYPDKSIEHIKIARKNAEKQPLSEEQDLMLAGLEAKAYAAKGDQQVAEDILLLLQSKRPNDPRIPDVLLQFYMQIGRYADALAIVDDALKRDPKSAGALLNRSALLIQMKEFDKAVETMNELLQIDPDSLSGRMNRAIALLQSGKLTEAKADYLILEKAMPQKSYAVYFGLGEIAYRSKQNDEAIKYYRQYLETAPKGSKEYKEVAERLNELQGVKAK